MGTPALPHTYFRNRYFFLLDGLCLSLLPVMALTLRLEGGVILPTYRWPLLAFIGLALAVKLPLFYAFGLYRRYWRYASIDELFAILFSVAAATGLVTAIYWTGAFLFGGAVFGLPRSVPLLDGLLTGLVVGGIRFSQRGLQWAQDKRQKNGTEAARRVLIVGAGDAGAMLMREMRHSTQVNLDPVGYVDDDPLKQRMVIHGAPVLGTLADIPRLVRDYRVQEIVIAMPTAPGEVIRAVLVQCEKAHVRARTAPGIYEIMSGRVQVSHLRNLDIEDLLRREPVKTDLEGIGRVISGRRVLVSGAGGSIGSELCRQIARNGPERLILLGHGENSLFTIQNELRHKWPALAVETVVVDIRDQARLERVYKRFQPQLVFHAAAHKHVPLMEANAEEAVTNNVGGTRCLVNLAEAYGVERLVLISSDKAVNPSNVMGVTKRIAELIVQAAAYRSGRPFVSVRFGNVLGSRGSVVPTFREQIARGGPVTVTHPDVQRYFMTIPESVQLVLQASVIGRPGDVFVLDMGEPICILDLARDLIELSGLKVGQDIEILFTGLRPGEKMFEELFGGIEHPERTVHEKIFQVPADRPAGAAELPPRLRRLSEQLDGLLAAAYGGDVERLGRWLKVLVPEYRPAGPAGFASAHWLEQAVRVTEPADRRPDRPRL